MPAAALAAPSRTATAVTRSARADPAPAKSTATETTADESAPTKAAGAAGRRPRRTDGIFGQLNAEWDQLARSRSAAAQVTDWGTTEPTLAGLRQLGDLTAHDATSRSRTTRDEALSALLRLAGGGDQLAGRAVLQLMLGEAARLTSRTTAQDAQTPEDHRVHVITCLWEAITGYPVDRPTPSAFNRLSLETIKGVTHRPAGHRDITVDHAELEHIPADTEGPTTAADERLLTLVHWGAHHGHITHAEARLAFIYHSPTQRDCHRRAEDLATSEQMASAAALRQRVSRITRRLSAAARDAAVDGDSTITALAS